MIRLLVSRESGDAAVYEFNQDEVLIGRVPPADVVLDNESVSRRHTRISKRPDGWRVALASGTFDGGRLGGRSAVIVANGDAYLPQRDIRSRSRVSALGCGTARDVATDDLPADAGGRSRRADHGACRGVP